MTKITIVLPEEASGELVELTEFLVKKFDLDSGGGLGGQYGYGVNYENEVFMMHPYCWCEEDTCRWCGPEDAPNFLYKPTGGKIWWYKWIARGERIDGKFDVDWLEKCKASIGKEGS